MGEGKTDAERRQQLHAGLDKAFADAKARGDIEEKSDFGNGFWIGVTNTVLAAESEHGLKLKPGQVYTFPQVKHNMDEALAKINPGDKDEKKILIKLLIINYWLNSVFEEGATFYFRHQWPTPRGRKCVFSEWPSAQAVLDDAELQ